MRGHKWVGQGSRTCVEILQFPFIIFICATKSDCLTRAAFDLPNAKAAAHGAQLAKGFVNAAHALKDSEHRPSWRVHVTDEDGHTLWTFRRSRGVTQSCGCSKWSEQIAPT